MGSHNIVLFIVSLSLIKFPPHITFACDLNSPCWWIVGGYEDRQLTYSHYQGSINITPLKERRKKHHLSLMYRLSRVETYLENTRPEINLRSRHKIKFSIPVTKLSKVMKSPFYRGASLWDRLSQEVQRATTKVRFKQLIA